MRHPLQLLAVVLAPACASARPAPAPHVLTRPTLAYEASFRGIDATERPQQTRAQGDLEIELRFRILRLGNQAAEALEGARGGPNAWTAPCADLARLEIEEAHSLGSPRMRLEAGRSTNWAILNQRAYVADFEVTGNSDCLTVDPVLAAYSTGLQCLVTTSRAQGERVDLELDLRQCDELGPPTERDLHVPGMGAPIVVQVPEILTQRLRTRTELGPDECLVLSWHDGNDPQSRVFALVTARAVPAAGTH